MQCVSDKGYYVNYDNKSRYPSNEI
jgi:hypothetical protein